MRTITANVSCKSLFCIHEIEEYTDLLFAFYSFSFKNTSLPHYISSKSKIATWRLQFCIQKKSFEKNRHSSPVTL